MEWISLSSCWNNRSSWRFNSQLIWANLKFFKYEASVLSIILSWGRFSTKVFIWLTFYERRRNTIFSLDFFAADHSQFTFSWLFFRYSASVSIAIQINRRFFFWLIFEKGSICTYFQFNDQTEELVFSYIRTNIRIIIYWIGLIFTPFKINS